jgi:hypothetical protein
VEIYDDDGAFNPAPSASIRVTVNTPAIEEGNQVATAGGANKLPFFIALSKPSAQDVTVEYYVTADGSATFDEMPNPGADFGTVQSAGHYCIQSDPCTATLPAGTVESDANPASAGVTPFQIPVYVDVCQEKEFESFPFTLQNATGATIVDDSYNSPPKIGRGFIRDDDATPC